MNREIKFRAWNKVKNIMVYDNEDDTYGDWEGCCDSNVGMINTILNSQYYKEYEFMQYTGLHDKNGKEIYEGDIVYCQTKYGKAKAIIKFIDGKFVAYWNSALTHPENGHHIACYEINKRFEVIGNIYDNPELLGGE